MIKAAIFDLDDTLYNYEAINKLAINNLCEYTCNILKISNQEFNEAFEYGRKATKEELGDCAAQHNRMLYCQKALEYLKVKPTLYALEMYEVYWKTVLENMFLNEGVIELFEFLKEKNIKIGICTDLTVHIQHRKIRKLGIDKYIDCIVSSEEAGREKPDFKMFNLCLKKLNITPDKAIYIGDSFKKDIIGAQNAGIKAFWFNGKSDKISKGQQVKAIEHILDLKEFI